MDSLFGTWYRLTPRGEAGLSCCRAGVALGPVSLIAERQGRYGLRPDRDLAEAFTLAYGSLSPKTFMRWHAGLGGVAKALERGEDALAALVAVQLGFPAIAPAAMAKLACSPLTKAYNPDQPRVPAGNDGAGEWTSDGGAGVQVAENESDGSPHAYEKMTTREVGNIVFNETRSLSGPGLQDARNAIAHAVRNGEDKSGKDRPSTASLDVPNVPSIETKAYQDSQNAANQADAERDRGIDSSAGATHFNITGGRSTRPFGGAYLKSYGPFSNSFPYGDVPAKTNVYINFFK